MAWDASTDASVAGYNVYYGGASGAYTNEITLGLVTNTTVSGLVTGATYYFAASAYNANNLESALSDEVSYQVPAGGSTSNHPPTLDAIGNINLNENAGQQTVSLSGITSGAVDEIQTLTVTAASGNTGLIPNPTVSYTNGNTTGRLTFTPVSNAYGTATITVTVNDGGASNNIVTRQFTVTVAAVNNWPTLDAIGNLTLPKNAGLQTVNLTGVSSGAANENQTLTVTAASGNTGLIPNPTVNYTNGNTTGRLTFTPVTDATGTATITVTVNDGGASNNIVTRQFTVTVAAGNEPPTLDAISNLTLPKNAGLQTVNLTGISSGATNENQTLTVTAGSGNTGLIPNPTVSYTNGNTTGRLTFTPVTDATGTATITVTVNDGGATNNLIARSFTVTVFSDSTRPAIEITSTKEKQQFTNGTVTLAGKASDDTAVQGVYYALNDSGWLPAATGNGWTNWTANLELEPGMNKIQAYAVDASGNVSKTNTVNLIYLVYEPLTVKTVGGGRVGPPHSGTELAVNMKYMITAVPEEGFEFEGWTGDVTNDSANLKFTMRTNLTLTANFVDVKKPTLSIVTPAGGQRLTSTAVTMTGKAKDNAGVQAVYYALNSSGWRPATTGDGWTNWTASLDLAPGTNTMKAYAVDSNGNVSQTNLVQAIVADASQATNTASAAKAKVESSAAGASLKSPAYASGAYAFNVAGASGDKFVVEVSSDLVHWTAVETNTAPFTFVDAAAGRFNQRFYRAVPAP